MKKNIAKAKQFYILPLVHDEACGCSSGVERNLAKVDVEGSNPFARSNKKNRPLGRFFLLEVGRGLEPEKRVRLKRQRKQRRETAVR